MEHKNRKERRQKKRSFEMFFQKMDQLQDITELYGNGCTYNNILLICEELNAIITAYLKCRFDASVGKYDNFQCVHDEEKREIERVVFSLISDRINILQLYIAANEFEALQFMLMRFTYSKSTQKQLERLQLDSDVFTEVKRIHEYFLEHERQQLLQYLKKFRSSLIVVANMINKQLGRDIALTSNQLTDLVVLVYSEVNYQSFYRDYQIFRDIDSLEQVKKYLKLVQKLQFDGEKKGSLNQVPNLEILVVERALQIISEYFLNSSFLSEQSRNQVKKCGVPFEDLMYLHQFFCISYSSSISKILRVENENTGLFKKVHGEILYLMQIVTAILDCRRLEYIQWQIQTASEYIGFPIPVIPVAIKHTTNLINELDNYVMSFNEITWKSLSIIVKRIKEKHVSPIYQSFDDRLAILQTIYIIAEKLIKLENRPSYESALVAYYKDNKLFKTAVEMLLSDISRAFTDSKFPLDHFTIEFYINVPLWGRRNTDDSIGETKMAQLANHFLQHRTEITAILKLLEFGEIERILYKQISADNVTELDDCNERWLNVKHSRNIQTQLLPYREAISIVINSPEYRNKLVSYLHAKYGIIRQFHAGDKRNVLHRLKHEDGINVNMTDQYGRTLLYYALQTNNRFFDRDIVGELLNKCATLMPSDYYVLDVIIRLDEVDFLTRLIYNANVDVHGLIYNEERRKKYFLHVAVTSYANKICYYLLEEEKVNPNVKDTFGVTPLEYAASAGFLQLVEMLIAHGATVKKTNRALGFIKRNLNATQERLESSTDYIMNKKLKAKIQRYYKIIKIFERGAFKE